jgi:hypothetical protein
MNHIPGGAIIRRSRTIVPLILIALIGTLALVIAPSKSATAAPPICTAGATSCPTPFPEPTPGPSCPARTPSSKPIETILNLSSGGVQVSRLIGGTGFAVSFMLQTNHQFNPFDPCFTDDGVATRFDQSSNIQSTSTALVPPSVANVLVVVNNSNVSAVYRFRLKYQQNSSSNPKFRTCTLVLPSGLAPGQQIYVAPTACATDG